MFNNDVENGPKSEYGRENLTQASANGNTDITNTAKSKEKKEMFQIENQSVLNFETKNTVFEECRNHNDQSKSPRKKTSRDMTDLKFSIHDGSNIVKKSSSSDGMQMPSTYKINPNERHPLQPINNITNSLNMEEPEVKSNIVNNKSIAYPPSLDGNEKLYDEDMVKSPSLTSKCSMKKNSNTRNKSFTYGTSNSLPEKNLECDSLGCRPDQSFQETLLGPLLLTNGAFEETKLQPVVGSHETYGKLQSTFQSLSDDLLKSLNDGRCELTTDGPTSSTKMTEYLSQQVIPALQQQEEKSQRIVNELSYQQKENQHLKEKINQLEQQLGLGHKNQLRMTSSQSQTHKAGCEYNKQFPVHYSIPVSEETGREETDLKPYNTSHEMRKLTAINKQLSDANHQWEVQWESLQRRQASEIERLNQVIRTFHEQEAKRQEDIDKILLSAKRRHNDAEDAKEDALGQLAQITGQFEELKAQYEELKTHLVQRTQEKSDLETELVNLKAEQMCLSQTKSKKESKSSDRKLIQQLKTDLQVLQQQLKVFEEDFDVERQDRAKAQSEKEKLKEELETARSENIKLTQKLRQSQQSQQSHYMNGHQHQPTAQPETDPYAQPFTPTMMLPRYNNQFTPNVVNTARQEQQEYGVWNCEFCTYVNHPQRVICEICGTQKGRAQVANTQSGFIPRINSGPQGQHQQPYFPGDLCMDSGAWLKCVCYAISGSLGENCKMSSQCKTSNSRCVNNYCICSDDTIDDNGVEQGGSCKPKSDFEPRYALATIINFSAMKLEWLAPKEISLIKNFIVIYTKAFLYTEFNITVPKSYTILTSHCYAEHRGFSAIITKLSMSTLYHIKVQSVLYSGQRVGVDFFNYTRTTAPRIHMDRKPLAPLVNFWWDHRYCDYFYVTLIGLQDSYNYTIKTKKNKLTATGLKPGLSYEFTIVPYKLNIGGSVNHITFRLPPTPPGPPRNLRYKIFHNKVVELNWEEPSKSNGFIDFYFIHIHVNGEKLNNTVVTPFRAKSWTFTEYVPGKTYCFSVYSHNDGDYNGTKAAHICTNNGFKSDNEKLKAKNHENIGFIPSTVVLSVFVVVSIAIIISLIIKMKMLANELEKCKRSHYKVPDSSDTTYSTLRT